MRKLLALAVLVFSSAADAAGMVPVPEKASYCAKMIDFGGACYEWKLNSDPSIRFVASGYEDGMEYSFYKRGWFGRYKHLIRVFPVLKDAAKPDALYWGYAWDIQDIAVVPDAKHQVLFATFKHSETDDGEVYSPPWQKNIPAVLFIGHTTQPDLKVPPLEFEARTLSSLIAQAKG